MSVRNCQHTKVDGAFCQAPPLNGRPYCRFHLEALGRRMRMARSRARREPYHLVLPILEDLNAVQVARMQVMDALASGQLDRKVGGLLLFGLQGASKDLRSAHAPRLAVYDPAVDAPRATEYPKFEEAFDLPKDIDLSVAPEVVFPAAATTAPVVAASPPPNSEPTQRGESEAGYRKVTSLDVELEQLRKQDREAYDRRLREMARAEDLRRQREERKLVQARYLVEADQRNQAAEQRMVADYRAWEAERFGPRTETVAENAAENVAETAAENDAGKKPSATVSGEEAWLETPAKEKSGA